MDKQDAFLAILGISVAGLLFSGYLSYTEIFAQSCALGSCTELGGIPTCIYGFFMYLLVAIMATIGLKVKPRYKPEE